MYQQYGIRCSRCGDEVYSNSRHDWEQCLCGGVFIDGGWDSPSAGSEPGVIAEKVSRLVQKKGNFYYSDEIERKKQLRLAGKVR